MKIKELRNKKIAVIWYWTEGKSTINFLIRLGITDITILDKDEELEAEENIDMKTLVWKNYLDNLSSFDVIFKSPWVSPYHPKLTPYRHKLMSQTQIFFDNYLGKVIWITATKGKSTTSTLIYETLKKSNYQVKLVGNIGTPVFDLFDVSDEDTISIKEDFVVYELSSYMLEISNPRCFIWLLGNLYACHVERHDHSLEKYHQAKLNLLKNSKNILINKEFEDVLNRIKTVWKKHSFWIGAKYTFDWKDFFVSWEKIFDDEEILLLWEHNKKNICATIWVLDIVSREMWWDKIMIFENLKKVLTTFSGLPHRMQNIGIYNWITFIDDGLSSTPDSTIEAIKTFNKNIWSLFLWWQDSWFEFENLRNILINYQIPNIVLFPDTGNFIFSKLSENMKIWEEKILEITNDYHPLVYKTDNMEDAVKFAYRYTHIWKICLMSSASPSFSIWKNYLEKWKEFKKYVEKYGNLINSQ